MNHLYEEIADLFRSSGIANFERLPEEKAVVAKFAKQFIKLNRCIEAALIQGFSWTKSIYTEELPDGTESYIQVLFDEPTYLALLHRYKELSSGGGGRFGGDPPFDLDTHITEIRTDAIDAEYMNSRFEKFFKLWQQGGYDHDTFESTLADLHKSFGMLSPEEQKYANLFIREIQSGDVVVNPDKTFRDYISEYMKREEDSRIARIVRRLGCYADKLRDLLNRKVTNENINDGNRFNELLDSVDRDRARNFFIVVEAQTYKEYRLEMLIDRYLRSFILSGGIDPYADVTEPNAEAEGSNTGKGNHNGSPSGERSGNGTSSTHSSSDHPNYHHSTSIKGKKLSTWYGGGNRQNALACIMDTGSFAYLEEKVCLNKEEYVQRGTDGKMHLTDYARTHEDECFLQFVYDNDGNLHYVKLPPSVADKEFSYYDFISEDILRQYKLTNEMSTLMLEAIERLEFGPALVKLMSDRVCNYSVGLLRSITGLDNRTIANLRKSENMTKLNVISTCLGIHIPFPVSKAMLDLAGLALPLDRGPADNMTYITLLSTRWASDYDDIVDDLFDQGLERLIKYNKKMHNK